MQTRRKSFPLQWAVVAALAGAPVIAHAQAASSTQPAAGALRVTVVEVTGNVQVRTDDSAPWQPAKVGIVVDEGAEFRTGPRSSVRCTIPPDQSFTLDRLGTVKVLTAMKSGTKLKTEMLMKYGRTKYSVEAAGLEHEGTISSPSGTLAVRGTVVSLYDQPPFVPEAVSYTGRAEFRDAARVVVVGAKGGSKQTLSANETSAAQTALDHTVTDPRDAGARTPSESRYIASQQSPGGLTSSDSPANTHSLPHVAPIVSAPPPISALPAGLDIIAHWTGRADVNLQVSADLRNPLVVLNDPNGFHLSEFLSPLDGQNKSPSGGTIPYNDHGSHRGGTELAYWPAAPQGAFRIGAALVNGPDVDLKVNVFLDGQPQSIFFTDAEGRFVKTTTLDVTLTPAGLPGTPVTFSPSVPLLEQFTPTGGAPNAVATRTRARHHSPAPATAPNPAAGAPGKPTSAAPGPPAGVTAEGRGRPSR